VSRLLATLALLLGIALGGVLFPVFMPARGGLRVPAELVAPTDDVFLPWRGASRDRSRHGKARRRARRAARA
jgi:hypothetical protein